MHTEAASAGLTTIAGTSGDARPSAGTTCALVALLCAPPLLYAYMGCYVENPDPFIYGQVAKEMLSGRRLYSETWQDKPPLAYVAYALPQIVFPRSYGAIGFFGGLCVAVTSALYAYAFRGTRDRPKNNFGVCS
jgi:hypothetical protein